MNLVSFGRIDWFHIRPHKPYGVRVPVLDGQLRFQESLADGPARVLLVHCEAEHAAGLAGLDELEQVVVGREHELDDLVALAHEREQHVGHVRLVVARQVLEPVHHRHELARRALDQLRPCVHDCVAAVRANWFRVRRKVLFIFEHLF